MIQRLFLDYPAKVDKACLKPARFPSDFAGWLLLSGLAAAVYAVLLFVCQTSARRMVRRLHAFIENRSR